jgi:hypothetical protein
LPLVTIEIGNRAPGFALHSRQQEFAAWMVAPLEVDKSGEPASTSYYDWEQKCTEKMAAKYRAGLYP